MPTPNEISITERRLLAAKGKLAALKQRKWAPAQSAAPFDPEAISAAEQEVISLRINLAKIIVKHYQVKF